MHPRFQVSVRVRYKFLHNSFLSVSYYHQHELLITGYSDIALFPSYDENSQDNTLFLEIKLARSRAKNETKLAAIVITVLSADYVYS